MGVAVFCTVWLVPFEYLTVSSEPSAQAPLVAQIPFLLTGVFVKLRARAGNTRLYLRLLGDEEC